jgi:hypothetical protein
MIKRYAVFAGEKYYPLGGWSDFVFSTDDFSEALNLTEEARIQLENHDGWRTPKFDWCHIVDTQTGKFEYEDGGRLIDDN